MLSFFIFTLLYQHITVYNIYWIITFIKVGNGLVYEFEDNVKLTLTVNDKTGAVMYSFKSPEINVTKEMTKNINIKMKRVHFNTDDGIFKGKIVVVVKNKNILDNLVQNIKKINGIDKVTRL